MICDFKAKYIQCELRIAFFKISDHMNRITLYCYLYSVISL